MQWSSAFGLLFSSRHGPGEWVALAAMSVVSSFHVGTCRCNVCMHILRNLQSVGDWRDSVSFEVVKNYLYFGDWH